MPRPRNLIPSSSLHMHMREDLLARLKLVLFSEVEQRIPQGALSDFFEARVKEYFDSRRLDLAPWTGAAPGSFIIQGPPEAITALLAHLNQGTS